MSHIFLSLGSNLGDRQNFLNQALVLLEQYGVKIVKRSSVLETDPVDFTDQPKFLNMVVAVETNLEPEKLLDICQRVENDLGRVRTVRFGPRVIDVDILQYRDVVLPAISGDEDQRLILPHPRLHERRFFLELLSEVTGNGY